MSVFAASEVYQFAVRIEENGEKFYRYAAQKMDDEKIKEMFNHLADEEVKHRETFGGFLSKIEKYEPPESYPGEYFAYLRAYVDRIIFPREKAEEKMAVVKDTASALEFGMQRELDSILYYHEVKNLIPEHQRDSIEKIINEERRHFAELGELKKSMG